MGGIEGDAVKETVEYRAEPTIRLNLNDKTVEITWGDGASRVTLSLKDRQAQDFGKAVKNAGEILEANR